MESHNAKNSFEFTQKNETGVIIFDQGAIKIPENLSSIIHGDHSQLIIENIITKENKLYILKIGPGIKLKIKIKLRINKENQRYSIEFGIGMGFFSRPILKFKNLDHENYQQILHLLEANNIFSKADLKEFDDYANDRIYTKNTFRYAIWGCISLFTLVGGLVILEFLTEKNKIVILMYYILNGVYLLYNMIIPLDLVIRPKNYSNPDRQRKIHITQKIARNLYLVVITFVYFFVFITR